ncbi:hypothetical protein GCM10011497_36160 [Elstera cyanobacteriorum]|uniref:PilZ domain-containing protein n=1 Tax=Elstera cyanobacteriorum TaxID=2022747 RepID=A0A255Y176_9PROT|nr:PilZ domain-containing protein [Elstera cyanobacteriorum]OYQ22240.1 hypothetical protein CHR90_00540 [Elstera cyanobacteriorum]GGA02253.1 hypothetical protein GCM10011497_36160 [Elstera cyanobacteriorum]
MAFSQRATRRYAGTANTPYNRHDKRYRDPVLRLDIGGRLYDTEDWGLGGFRVAGFRAPFTVGDHIDGIILNDTGSPAGRFTVQLVSTGGADTPARFRFHQLSDAAFELLQGYVLRPQ